jgi:hypothetical protein
MKDRSAFNQPYINEVNELRGAANYHINDAEQLARIGTACERMIQICESKDQDYSGSARPMENLRGSEEFGIEAWRGVLLRMADKRRRLATFRASGILHVQDESADDTLMDLCNYSILCKLLYAERAGVDIRIPDALKRIALHSLLALTARDESWDSHFEKLNLAFEDIKAVARRNMQEV